MSEGSGQWEFIVRVPPEVHRRLALEVAESGLILMVVFASAMAAGNSDWGHITQTQHYDGKIYFSLDIDIN